MRRPETSIARPMLREPLLHFALLAAMIFAAHAAFGEPARPPGAMTERQLTVDPAYLEGLQQRELLSRGSRPDPTAVERDWIREEILVREAMRLGLDRGDPVVRSRLVQKMEVYLATEVRVEPLSEAELEGELEARATSYRREPRLGFEHVFFLRRDEEPPTARAERALAALAEGAPKEALSDPFLLGLEIAPRPLSSLRGSFGAEFVDALAAAEEHTFGGPYESSFGWHLVRVNERHEAGLPPLAAVRERLESEVRDERRAARVEARIEELVESYRIERAPR